MSNSGNQTAYLLARLQALRDFRQLFPVKIPISTSTKTMLALVSLDPSLPPNSQSYGAVDSPEAANQYLHSLVSHIAFNLSEKKRLWREAMRQSKK